MTHRVVTPIPIQTTGTEFITCFEQFFIWEDHAEFIRDPIY